MSQVSSEAQAASGWQFWIDRGGTFTDVVARRPGGGLVTRKLLSENPEQYGDAACHAIRGILQIPVGPIPAGLVQAVKMGTTVATNALLERKGEPTVLFISRGFGDALAIGYQNRPRLFDRAIRLPEQLYARVIEIDERVAADGRVLKVLDRAKAEVEAREAHAAGFRAAAIVLMHGYRHDGHERQLAEILRGVGFTQISVSHETIPLMKLVGRGDTTVADAYLSPILRRYVDQVASDLGPEVPLSFMQSNGGLTSARRFRGKDAILSGPAGGIVGMTRAAERAGFGEIIGFDMGGTSTDVSHWAGAYERTFDTTVAGVRLRAPMMQIHTVAAGGGSICRFDGSRYRVGPESAGAHPGPACYRRGGPLTVTDCNVMLGKLQSGFFPAVFGPNADEPLDEAAVVEGFQRLADEARRALGAPQDPKAIAEGLLTIAVQNMASAIKQISIARGYDVRRYALVCFGGAAGQHACLVADALGMTRILVHPLAGVLSAYGMGLAEHRRLRQESVEAPLTPETLADVRERLAALEQSCREELAADGFAATQVRTEHRIQIKYAGSDTALETPFGDVGEIRAVFEGAYRARFAFLMPDHPLVVEAATAEVIARPDGWDATTPPPAAAAPGAADTTVLARFAGADHETPVYRREALAAGQALTGPAIICEATATTVLEPGWRATVSDAGDLVLDRVAASARPVVRAEPADPILVEVFNNLFMSVAEQMGAALQNTAHSVNIKERLDFSCALFDRQGSLVANAPHMPVHLGSMGDSVRAALQAAGPNGRALQNGDVIALNNPYDGGTHLPDITVVMPVFDDGGDLQYVLAARGHHADIGGATPGSMPAGSRTVHEEGVLIDKFLLVESGRLREAAFRKLLGESEHPARNPDQNLADIKAQVAACAKGAEEIANLCEHYGADVVLAYMQYVQENAADCVRRMLRGLKGGSFRYAADDGWAVEVRIDVDPGEGRAVFDFTGTSGQLATNFNAPSSICRAAVLYVVRTLLDDDIPMNDGCLAPIEVIIPPKSLLAPEFPAAVVAGNVETSQMVTDALYGATGALAAAQGTMNNFTFGNASCQYYETICGGAGAGPDFAGAHAVHTHMTNSRMTDPEVLEWRYPVVVDAFAIRRGSGGEGRHRGGDGVIRRLTFSQPVTATILSNRRRVPPFGLQGGGAGAPGRNWVERADGAVLQLGGKATIDLAAGDTFVIETPGGGGYGAAGQEDRS